jgi:hypothetical protein
MLIEAETVLDAVRLAWPYWPMLLLPAFIGLAVRTRCALPLTRLVWSASLLWYAWAGLWLILHLVGKHPDHLVAEEAFWWTGAILIPLTVLLAVRERNRLGLDETSNAELSALEKVDRSKLVELAADVYRSFDRRVELAPQRGKHDPDLILYPHNGQKWIVKCLPGKKWASKREVVGFYKTLKKMDLPRGALICPRGFSKNAQSWSVDKPLHLYSGEDLLQARQRGRENQRDQKAQKEEDVQPRLELYSIHTSRSVESQ